VAATRARDYLVIPLFWGKRKGFFSLLEGKLPGMDEMHPWSVVDGQLIAGGGCFDLQPAEKPPLRLDLGESERARETPWQRRIHWKETLDSVKEKASRGLPLLAPSSSAFLDFPPYFFDEKTEPRASGKGSEESGLYFGLAFHAVMERLDLASGSNLGDLSRVKAMDQSIPGLAEKIETLCRRCVDHPLMERARKSKRIFREVPFSVSLNDNIVEGKIDLLFEEGGSWVIVDYKTDDVSGESLEQRFQSYQEQGTWYARAVHQATGGKVKEVTFFFVRSGKVRTIKLQG